MTIHRTDSGYIELLDTWGHGRAPNGDWYNRPATLIADDGDGHYEAWAYEGAKADAAMALAMRERDFDEPVLWVLEGNSVTPLRRPDWADGVEENRLDDDGELIEVIFHPDRHPGGLCVG